MLNEGSKPTFIGAQGESIIDITIVNKMAYNMLSEWRVEENDFGSDHRAITFCCNTEDEWVESRQLKKADWGKFGREIEKRLTKPTEEKTWTVKRVEKEAEEIKNAIISSLDSVAPLRRQKRPKTKISWWNDKLSKLRAKMKKLRHKHTQE